MNIGAHTFITDLLENRSAIMPHCLSIRMLANWLTSVSAVTTVRLYSRRLKR